MHDLFDILGVPSTARPLEVRRVCARRVRRCHPDFQPSSPIAAQPFPSTLADAAVEFADMSSFVDRIQASFFGPSR